MTQGLRSVFGVAAPEEIVKVLVIVAVSVRRRTFADPMDTVVYGAAGLGFAAYENLAYLVQHSDMWRSLAALRSVLTCHFTARSALIAGAYIAIARAGTALGAHRIIATGRGFQAGVWRCSRRSRCHAAFDFPLLTLQKHPDLGSTTRMMLGAASLLIGFSSIGFAIRLVRRVGRHHAPRTEIARERLSLLRRMWALLLVGSGPARRAAFVLTRSITGSSIPSAMPRCF